MPPSWVACSGPFLHRSERMRLNQAKRLLPQVLPPLKDVKIRPEVGSTLRNKLVRLMTHVDMGVKQTAAEFLFVLCKESGERRTGPWLQHAARRLVRSFKAYLLMMSWRSGQPVEVHRVRKRSGTPGGPRTPGGRERRDAVLRRRGLGHGGVQIRKALVRAPVEFVAFVRFQCLQLHNEHVALHLPASTPSLVT